MASIIDNYGNIQNNQLNPNVGMAFPNYVGPGTPFNHEWFNQITQYVLRLQSDILELQRRVHEKLNCAECGATVAPDDYLCQRHRRIMDENDN